MIHEIKIKSALIRQHTGFLSFSFTLDIIDNAIINLLYFFFCDTELCGEEAFILTFPISTKKQQNPKHKRPISIEVDGYFHSKNGATD